MARPLLDLLEEKLDPCWEPLLEHFLWMVAGYLGKVHRLLGCGQVDVRDRVGGGPPVIA